MNHGLGVRDPNSRRQATKLGLRVPTPTQGATQQNVDGESLTSTQDATQQNLELESLTPTQGATQRSVDEESLTPSQGAMQQSMDCESLTPTQAATQQSVVCEGCIGGGSGRGAICRGGSGVKKGGCRPISDTNSNLGIRWSVDRGM